MFERFTEQARQVVVLAQEEARTLRHNYIGTEHILLGLLRVHDEVATQVLESLGLSLERARAQMVRIVGTGEEPMSGQIPFTPRTKKVLELALREALSLGHNYIGPEHVLLGLVRENEGVAVRILLDFDADAEKIRTEVMRVIPLAGGQERQHGTSSAGVMVNEVRFTATPDRDLRRLLRAAAGRAMADERDEFGLADLLAAAQEHREPPEGADPGPTPSSG